MSEHEKSVSKDSGRTSPWGIRQILKAGYKTPFYNDVDTGKEDELASLLEDLLVKYGGELLLKVMGQVLQSVEGAGTAAAIGRAVEILGEIEW